LSALGADTARWPGKAFEIEADKQLLPVFRSLCRQLPGAARRLRDLIEKIPAAPQIADRNPLEPLDVIASQATTGGESLARLIEIIMARHRDVQTSKGKGMWIEPGERWTLMPGFGLARDVPPQSEVRYLHSFRMQNAYSFLAELGLSASRCQMGRRKTVAEPTSGGLLEASGR